MAKNFGRKKPLDISKIAMTQAAKKAKSQKLNEWRSNHKQDVDYVCAKLRAKGMFVDQEGTWFESTHGHEVSESYLRAMIRREYLDDGGKLRGVMLSTMLTLVLASLKHAAIHAKQVSTINISGQKMT